MNNTDIVMYLINKFLDFFQSGVIVTLYSLIDIWVLDGTSLNPCTFASCFGLTLTELYELLHPFITLGLLLTLLIFVVNVLTSGILRGLSKQKDSIIQLALRALICVPIVLYGICIFWGPPESVSSGKMNFKQYEEDEVYVGGLFGIFDKFYHDIKLELVAEELDDLTEDITTSIVSTSASIVDVEESEIESVQSKIEGMVDIASTALSVLLVPIKVIISIICIVIIIKDMFKLLLDIIKRYLFINASVLFFPIVGSTFASSNTSPILGSFVRLIVGQFVLHIVSEFFLFGFIMMLVNIITSGIMGMFLIIGWLQLGLALNNQIQALGVNAPTMGMNMLDEMSGSVMRFMMLDRAGGTIGKAVGNTVLNKAAASGNLGLAKAGLVLQGKNGTTSSALDAMSAVQKNSGIRTASTEQGIFESYSHGNYATAANAINGYYNGSEKDAACRNLMSSVYGDKLSTLPLGKNGMNAFHDLTPMDNGNIKGLMDVYDDRNNRVGTTAFTLGPDVNPKASTSLGQTENNSNRMSYIDFNSTNTLDPGNRMVWNSSSPDYPCAAELMTGSLDTSGMTSMQKSEFRQNCSSVETSQNGDVIYKNNDNQTMAVKTRNNAFYYRGQNSDNEKLRANLQMEQKLGYQSISSIKTQQDGSRLIEGTKLNPVTNKYEKSTEIMYNACDHPEAIRKGILLEGGYRDGTWVVVNKNAVSTPDNNKWKRSQK